MLLGIGLAVLLLGAVAYVTWLVRQAICTGPRMRRLEKKACKQAWREDREDRALRRASRTSQQNSSPRSRSNSNNSDRRPSSAGSRTP